MKDLPVRVFRFNPGIDEQPHYQHYLVRVREGARVLHVLHAVHDEHDPTLSYRYCCGSGQCGSCAVRVNGEPVLACTEEAREGMTIDPLDLPVRKDLIVDMEPYLAAISSLEPGGEFRMPTLEEVEAIKPLRSCIECLACVSACPALKVIEFAGPTAMREDMRLSLDPRDSRDRVTEAVSDGLFTCTSCQACWKVCPKDIEIPGKAIEKLRALANRKGLTLPRHQSVEKLVRETGRSVDRTETTFLEQIPEVLEPYGEVKGTVGFFVGCMYNMRLPQTALDAMEVLRRNGIRVVIPKEQVCCGSPLIRTGQIEFLQTLQRRNIEAFVHRGIDTVVTMCAGCGSTLKNDYDCPFRVMDINEILLRYEIEPPARLTVKATYHDPCHLLRGQGIRTQPRELLSRVVDLVEMPSVCCGSGGGVRSGVPEEAAALGENRRKEIEKTGADIVISSCPFCEYHIQEHTDRPVKNITTVLLEGYREKDRKMAPKDWA
ncbi:MAG: succinate dehydrogenase/fumarate reductase iron-sulfur subunit [Methanomicrobiales archaeon]|nr:succinate dehydrogenase/fumarate reductase iron-sulfur subunit [Methanomicrobiales archaeon]NYT20365.1 succinate dehydrogenase/fumarate reductase iron-sulfur subunit [Methanomicrobiales archaeon]